LAAIVSHVSPGLNPLILKADYALAALPLAEKLRWLEILRDRQLDIVAMGGSLRRVPEPTD
jgi:hypothetical protein